MKFASASVFGKLNFTSCVSTILHGGNAAASLSAAKLHQKELSQNVYVGNDLCVIPKKSFQYANRNGTQAVPYGNILINILFRGCLIHFETAPLLCKCSFTVPSKDAHTNAPLA